MEKKSIYKRLADVRVDKDIKQKDIAEILNITSQTISKWEHGEGPIPLIRINEICNVTNSTIDYTAGLTQKKTNTTNLNQISKELVGSRLREFRKTAGFTQQELADKLKTTQSTISAYENGKTLLLSSFAYQIARDYNVSMDWLCGRSEEMWIDEKGLTKK